MYYEHTFSKCGDPNPEKLDHWAKRSLLRCEKGSPELLTQLGTAEAPANAGDRAAGWLPAEQELGCNANS